MLFASFFAPQFSYSFRNFDSVNVFTVYMCIVYCNAEYMLKFNYAVIADCEWQNYCLRSDILVSLVSFTSDFGFYIFVHGIHCCRIARASSVVDVLFMSFFIYSVLWQHFIFSFSTYCTG